MAVLNLFEDEPGWTNQERAEKAAMAAFQYSEGGLTPDYKRPLRIDLSDITRDDIVDLMTDLYHLADRIGLDTDQLTSCVAGHFEAEKE